MQGKSAHDQMTPEGKSENRDCNRLPTPTTGSATSGKLTLKPTIMNPLIVHTDSGGDSSIVQQRHQVPLVDQNPGTALRGCCLQFQKSGRLEKIIWVPIRGTRWHPDQGWLAQTLPCRYAETWAYHTNHARICILAGRFKHTTFWEALVQIRQQGKKSALTTCNYLSSTFGA